MKSDIDHVQHGWALLALRMPEIRQLSRHTIDEICESYSLAIIRLQALQRSQIADPSSVDEYKTIVSELEQEACYFLAEFKRPA